MAETYDHLRISREQPTNERRASRGYPRIDPPENPAEHGQNLLNSLQETRGEAKQETVGGFDTRYLLKLQVDKNFSIDKLNQAYREVEFVSQEDETLILAFATENALEEFEARLTTLAQGDQPKYRRVLYALRSFGNWAPEDRMGPALRVEGVPEKAPFVLDVELLTIGNPDELDALTASFEAWLNEKRIEILDSVRQPNLLLYRLRVDHEGADLLLRYRDVRTVDLPPSYGMDRSVLQIELDEFEVSVPPEDAPGVVILDSGITAHPFLHPALGTREPKSFLPNDPSGYDDNGHGTSVAGVALYGDIEQCVQNKEFVPEIHLFSGRILDEQGENASGFVENHIANAVRHFRTKYGCIVFNLSFGDERKPYQGSHVRGLAVTLDNLAREEGVLFVVSAGNFNGTEEVPNHWRNDYPGYFSSEETRILDPAPALNTLTVGSVARWDQTFASQRFDSDPAEIPIARRDQPSPFTRTGPSVNGAIKPDLVAYGGNWAINARAGNYIVKRGLGELTTSANFIGGRLLLESCGTSLAAPHVAHLATRLLSQYPEADANLVRALMIAHAKYPEACIDLFEDDLSLLQKVCGYGKLDEEGLLKSTERTVTITAQDVIENERHHFYEIPIPEDFYSRGRRNRELTVALAYTPAVRTTRVNYKASRIYFKLVPAETIEEVLAAYDAATPDEDYESISEYTNNRDVSFTDRSRGTNQTSTWKFHVISNQRRNQRLFVVVTRNDYPWGTEISRIEESYSLAICFRDQENEEARLYSQVRNILRERVRQRARV